jgi:hypothetical protein
MHLPKRSVLVTYVLVVVHDFICAFDRSWEANESTQQANNEPCGYQPRETAIAAPDKVVGYVINTPSPHTEGHNTQQWCPHHGLCLTRSRAYPSGVDMSKLVFTGTAQELRQCPLDGSGPEGLYMCALDDWMFSYYTVSSAEIFIYSFQLFMLCEALLSGLMCSFCFFAFDFVRHVIMHVMYDPDSDVEKLMDRIQVPTSPQEPTSEELLFMLSLTFFARDKLPRLMCIVCWNFFKYADTRIRDALSMMSPKEYDNTVYVEPVQSSDSKVTCPICMVFETNTRVSCGHTFCLKCIGKCHQSHDASDTQCPICKSVITRIDTIYHPG